MILLFGLLQTRNEIFIDKTSAGKKQLASRVPNLYSQFCKLSWNTVFFDLKQKHVSFLWNLLVASLLN